MVCVVLGCGTGFFFALNVHFKVRTGPWLWDRLFGRRGHRREEHEGGGGGTKGFDTRAGRSVVCRLCLPLIADTVSMLWTLKDNI